MCEDDAYKPKVSIIVPVYNTERYVANCLDSLLAQSYRNIEVICVDDCSTDGSFNVVKNYAARDSRVIALRLHSNLRQGAARNVGLDRCSGEYVLFVDSDDMIRRDAVSLLVSLAQREKAETVCFRLHSVSDHGVQFGATDDVKFMVTDSPLKYSITRNGFRIESTPCRLYSRKAIKDIRFLAGISYEDEAFTWEVMLHHPRTVILENIDIYHYLCNPDSTMHREFNENDIRYYCQIVDYLLDRFPKSGRDRRYLTRLIFPRLLKEQLMRIQELQGDAKAMVSAAFADEIRRLIDRRAYSLIGIGFRRNRIYKKLLRSVKA